MLQGTLNSIQNFNTEIKNVPSVFLSFHQSSRNPSTHLYSSVHHSSLSAPLHLCRFMYFFLQASVFTTDVMPELSFSLSFSHFSLPMLNFHERKRRIFQATTLSQMPLRQHKEQVTFNCYNNGSLY